MSYDNCDEGWTELEISSGIPSLVWGDGGCAREIDVKSRFNIEDMVSKGWDVPEVRCLVSKALTDGSHYYMAKRYSDRERLPYDFQLAAKESRAISILIKGLMKKGMSLFPGRILNNEISQLEHMVSRVLVGSTVYDRVGMIQNYIHLKADELWGEGGRNELPSNLMKNVLSAARLHLELDGMINHPREYWCRVWDAERRQIEVELLSPAEGFIVPGKTKQLVWRSSKMVPLTNFSGRKIREALVNISRIPMDTEIGRYRKKLSVALACVEKY